MKVLLVLALALPLAAQVAPKSAPKPPAPGPKAGAATAPKAPMAGATQQVAMSQARLRDAAVAGDFEMLEKLLADNAAITLPDGRFISRKQLLDALHATAYNGLQYADMQVRMLGPLAAAVTARLEVNVRQNGQDLSGAFRITCVWHKQLGLWKAVALQATAVQ